ncbi:MAG: hypothetical protein ACUVQH_14610, partial [Thermogutta sp.]
MGLGDLRGVFNVPQRKRLELSGAFSKGPFSFAFVSHKLGITWNQERRFLAFAPPGVSVIQYRGKLQHSSALSQLKSGIVSSTV